MKKIILFSISFLISIIVVNAQDKAFIYQGKKAQTVAVAKFEPFVDGKLSDEIWNLTVPFVLTHLNGAAGVPYDKTTVKVTATKTNLFISFYCEEPKPNDLIVKAQNPDDEMINDDYVSILISPGFEIESKPYLLSINGKGIISDSRNKDKSWNWEGATVAVAKGEGFWSVEMSLPLVVFEKEYKKLKWKCWRANFYRVRPERGWEDTTAASWASITGTSMFDLDQSGYMFLDSLGEKIPEGAVPLVPAPETEYLSLPSAQVPKFDKDEILIDGDIREQINAGAIALSFKKLDNKPDPTTNKTVPLKNKTEGWVCTVKDSLVVSVRCYDSTMDKLVSTEKIRDSGNAWADDSVEIFLKIGAEESSSYYHIAVNAHGSIYDSFEMKPEWNGNNIKAATVRKENYWDLELQIPFEDIDKEKIKASMGQPWRFNIVRHRAIHQAGEEIEEAAWSPTNSTKSHVPSRFGYIFMDVMNAKPK